MPPGENGFKSLQGLFSVMILADVSLATALKSPSIFMSICQFAGYIKVSDRY